MASGKERANRRDNFNQSVIQILYKRAGGRCCKCRAATFGPITNNPNKYRNIGQAAHIAAAAPGGPRYNPEMSIEERTSAANGLWLCSNCHDQVDRDLEEFTVAVLKKMRREAEDMARKEIGIAAVSTKSVSSGDTVTVGVSAATIVEIRKAKGDLQQRHGQQVNGDDGEQFLEAVGFINIATDSYLPQVGKELMEYLVKLAAYCNDASVSLEVIRRLEEIADTFNSVWSREEVELISHAAHTLAGRFSQRTSVRRSPVSRSAVALLKGVSNYKDLQKKKLDAVPKDLLRSLKGRDEPDVGPPRKKSKGLALDGEQEDGEQEDMQYLEIMEQLTEAKDCDTVLRLESQLDDMGCEPNIL